jgi:hypothetical protein
MMRLELRDEFLQKHMRGTAIELVNKQNTGWAQRPAEDLLRITYPTADVQRSLEAISTAAPGKPVVFLGQRGRGKSHIMALLHHAFLSAPVVEKWAKEWGTKLNSARLSGLKLQNGFLPITETMSNHEYPTLWDLIFDRHPKGSYYKGKFEQAGTTVPAKTLMQDLFAQQRTALILDEFQTWFDGLNDDPGDTGKKRRQWAFNFIQILAELASERPDLLMLVVSVRDNTTEAFKQIHRNTPVIVDFRGETAKDDRKRLLLHRLFKNRENFSDTTLQQVCGPYASERNRLLYSDETAADQDRRAREVLDSWPFSPELLTLLEDHILMAEAAQASRDLIRVLAEVFRARGQLAPILTAADFQVSDDNCGVTTLVDSFATSADQERLRDKAQRNLGAIRDASIPAPNAEGVISSIWMRSIAVSSAQAGGATKAELQLDVTRAAVVDDNAFAAELAEIVENSFNIHRVGAGEKRFCFKLEDNPESKLKAWARNDRHFDVQTATPPGLLAVRPDQEHLRKTLEHFLRSPDGVREQPSRVIVLDPNWERAPWANQPDQDKPERWDRPVLIVLPVAPKDIPGTLGPWLATHVSKNRNMTRFLLPKSETQNLYEDHDLIILARCSYLAMDWRATEPKYGEMYDRFTKLLKKDGLSDRFDRYALLDVWNYQDPKACAFHVEAHEATGANIPSAIEKQVRANVFAPEDFAPFIVEAAKRSDTMSQVLALMRDPSTGVKLIPYLGDAETYEQVLRVAAKGLVAINREGKWHKREAGQSFEEALQTLKQRAVPTGWEWNGISLGLPGEVGGGGVAVPVTPVTAVTTTTTPTTTVYPPVPPTPPTTPVVPPGETPQPQAPVIRKSLGAKTGINLLGDLEKWALPDGQRITQTTLTFAGLSVKELRDLCTKLPTRLAAELQVTLPPEGSK